MLKKNILKINKIFYNHLTYGQKIFIKHLKTFQNILFFSFYDMWDITL